MPDRRHVAQIELLGGVRVSGAQGPIPIRSRKARGVLAYVAAHPQRPPARAKLAGLLWPESDDEHARGSLRQALYVLRQALPDGALDAEGDRIRLANATVDVDALTELFDETSVDATRRVLELYRGDFLDGFFVDSVAFENWVATRRRTLRERTIATLETAVEALADEAPEVAIDAALHIVVLEPLREAMHRRLMRLYADAGRVDAALRQYRMCEEAVRRELGGSPAPETTRLRNELARRGVERPDGSGAQVQSDDQSGRQLRSMTALVVGDAASGDGWEEERPLELHDAVDRFDCEMVPGLPGTVVACFGLDRPRARDVETAATAALLLVEEFGDAVSIGVESGQAVVARRDGAFELAGGPVGAASRLQAVAGPGEIRVGRRASQNLSDRFELDPLDGDDARLVHVRTDTFSGVRGPFVGRGMERDILVNALEWSTQHAVVAVLYGPEGIGKSRLADEVLRTVASRRVIRVNGQSTSMRFEVDPLARIARTIVGENPSLLDALDADERRLVQELCDPETPDDTTSLMERRVEAARLMCADVLAREPMVLAFDDADACVGSTMRELSELVFALRDRPLAVLVTASHMLAALSPRARTVRLELGPLDDECSRALARELAIDESDVERCVQRAGGNPLFLERLADLGPDEALPHTVQSTILAAVARCSSRQRRTLEAAAVLGAFFDAEALARVCDERVEPGTLLATDLVRMEGTGRYAFVHSVARDAIEQAVEPGRRATLHRRAAECFPDQPAVRAEHLDQAGSPDAAASYLQAAQDRMAHARWGEAISLAHRGGEVATSDDERWQLDAVRARALRKAGRLQASADTFHDLAHRAADAATEARARLGVAEALRVRGLPDGALRALARAEERARDAERRDLLGHVHYLRGSIHFQTGAIDACAREHQAALEIAVERSDGRAEARASSGLADALYMRGEMEDAGRHFERCVRLAREEEFRHVELANLPMLGLTHFYRGDVDVALAHIFDALRGARHSADRRSEMVAANTACDVLLFTGDWPALHDAAQRCLGIATGLGSTTFAALSRAYRGLARAMSGDVERGLGEIEGGRRIILADGAEFAGPHVLGLFAAVCRDPDLLRQTLIEAEELLAQNNLSHNHLLFRPLAMLGVVRLGLEDDAMGLAAQIEALEDYAGSGATEWATIFRSLADGIIDGDVEEVVDELVARGFGIARDFGRAARG